MAITPEIIETAKEWSIRSLISRTQFGVVGSANNILTIQELEDRFPKEISKTFTSHPLIGDHMKTDSDDMSFYITMSITDMVARMNSEVELIGGTDGSTSIDITPSLDWLGIPGDEDKYHIVLIIRKFLAHQPKAHASRMSVPSPKEERDYRYLRQLHDHLLEGAEDWINRDRYIPVDKTSEITTDDILNASMGTGQNDTSPGGRKVLSRLGGSSSLGLLSDSASMW